MRGLSNSGLVVGVGSAECTTGACTSISSVAAMLIIVGVLGNGGVDWKPMVRTFYDCVRLWVEHKCGAHIT